MSFRNDFDVVIVGAGVAGGAMGTRLARSGLSVLMLERTQVHVDRIRGEWLAPWGIAEAMQLGLLDGLLAAGGHYVTKHFSYGDGSPIEAVRARPIDMATLVPGVAGAMTLSHPGLCDVPGSGCTGCRGHVAARGGEYHGGRGQAPCHRI